MHSGRRTDRRVRQRGADEVDGRADARVARLAARYWGVLSLAELLTCGLTRQGVTVRVRAGRLHRLHRGVYAVGHPNPPREGHLLAALKACGPTAALSHFAAAVLWGLVAWDGRPPDVTVAGDGTRLRDGIRVHRTAAWPPGERTTHHGLTVTSPARTLIDLAAVVDAGTLRRAVREALAQRLVDHGQLIRSLAAAGSRRGAAALRAILAAGPAPTRSQLEDAVLDLIMRHGFAAPEVNVPLCLGGRRFVPDFRWPEQRLVVEADGVAWHDNAVAREDDAERQALLEAHGERVVRVTWSQALGRPRQTVARLRAAGAPTASTGAAGTAAR